MNLKLHKKNENETDFYLVAIIIIALALSCYFYLFWVNGHILKQTAANVVHLAPHLKYFKERTDSFQDFIPNTFGDFFPQSNPVLTINFLILFFPLFKSYKYLILTKILAIEISIIVFYLLSKLYLRRVKAFFITILYATSPFILFITLHDYKPDYIALPFVFLIFHAWKKRNYKTFLFSSIFLATTKQNFMPFLVLFGIYLYIKERNKKYALTSFVIGALSSIIYLALLIKFPSLNSPFENNWDYTIFDILKNPGIILSRGMHNFPEFIMLFPYLLFAPLLAPEILFLALPKIIDNLLGLGFHRYTNEIVLLIPFLYIALLLAIKRIRIFLSKNFSNSTAKITLNVLLLSILIINFNSINSEVIPNVIMKYEGEPTLNCGCCDFDKGSLTERYNSLMKIIENIPEGSTVIAPTNIQLFLIEEDIKITNSMNEADILIRDMCLYECHIDSPCIQHYKMKLEENNSLKRLIRFGDFMLMKKQ